MNLFALLGIISWCVISQSEDACSDLTSNFTNPEMRYGSLDHESVNVKASYLWIKQSVCVLDVIQVAIQTIVGSVWEMHVHVRQARLDKYSQEAAPNDNGPHALFQHKETNHGRKTNKTDFANALRSLVEYLMSLLDGRWSFELHDRITHSRPSSILELKIMVAILQFSDG